ncbi:MAG TPA: twin-arginine translocase TatA/TatE family subunit [Candidatus Limnocylindrales bacterium]|nr:twin-arginine translocase TatA/TatE family subunit [Candidatus Limnocylindrales bacterium]
MFEGLTPTHLILVLAIALIVLGPGKLPEAGAALGKAIRGFRDAATGRDEPSPPATTPPADPSAAGEKPAAGPPTLPPIASE